MKSSIQTIVSLRDAAMRMAHGVGWEGADATTAQAKEDAHKIFIEFAVIGKPAAQGVAAALNYVLDNHAIG